MTDVPLLARGIYLSAVQQGIRREDILRDPLPIVERAARSCEACPGTYGIASAVWSRFGEVTAEVERLARTAMAGRSIAR